MSFGNANSTGLLVPPADPQALATTIDALLADPERARALGSAARQLIEQKYAFPRVAAQLGELYRRAVGWPTASPETPDPVS